MSPRPAVSEYRMALMAAIGEGPRTLAAVAEALQSDRRTLAASLEGLRKRGWAVLEEVGRTLLWSLTMEGREALASMRAEAATPLPLPSGHGNGRPLHMLRIACVLDGQDGMTAQDIAVQIGAEIENARAGLLSLRAVGCAERDPPVGGAIVRWTLTEAGAAWLESQRDMVIELGLDSPPEPEEIDALEQPVERASRLDAAIAALRSQGRRGPDIAQALRLDMREAVARGLIRPLAITDTYGNDPRSRRARD